MWNASWKTPLYLKRDLNIKEALEKINATKTILLILGLLGTSMVIGDGVLTPCISGHSPPPPNLISKISTIPVKYLQYRLSYTY